MLPSPFSSHSRRAPLTALLAVLLAVVLSACSAAAAGLNSYQSPDGRYAFLYPTGWTRVQVTDGPQVVFHDLINADETLSLV
ncbi:MAG: photosystem II reaction center PsbP, partial [Vulcanococcus sp.]